MGPVLLAEEAILEEIIRTYTAGRLGYRDAMLRVGKLIGDYVRAVLLSSVGLNIQERIDQEKTRAKAILAVAKGLDVSLTKVSALVRCYGASVALTGGTGEVGGLSYSAIRSFAVCVRCQAVQTTVRNRERATAETLAKVEDWEVKTGYDWAPELFRQAREEAWTDKQVRDRLDATNRTRRFRSPASTSTKYVLQPAGHVATRNMTPKEIDEYVSGRPGAPLVSNVPAPDLIGVVKNGSPHDAAEVIANVVRMASDPEALARSLMAELAPYLSLTEARR